MKNRRIFALLSTFASCAFVALAQTGTPTTDPSRQLSDMAKANKDVETIRCHYDMTRSVALLADDIKDEGVFRYCKSAGGFSLTSASPDGENTTVTNEYFENTSSGKTVRLSVGRNPAMRQMLDMVGGCLTGDFSALAKYGEVSYFDAPKSFTVLFTPKDKRAMRHVKSISMTFGKGDYSMVEMTMTAPNGDKTIYRFGAKDYSAGCEL